MVATKSEYLHQGNDGSAMVATKYSHQENGKEGQTKAPGREKKKEIWCSYCRKTGHIKDKCWKFHVKQREWNQRIGRPISILASKVRKQI